MSRDNTYTKEKTTREREINMNKKTIILGIIISLIIATLAIIPYHKTYAKTAVVIEITDNIVFCEDCNGESWAFESAENWAKGDMVSMVMDNMGTKSIYDDEIRSARHCGTVKDF